MLTVRSGNGGESGIEAVAPAGGGVGEGVRRPLNPVWSVRLGRIRW
jgi:hypothetical protein